MRKAFFIARKEWLTAFKSPLAYIVIILNISLFNVIFFMIIDQNHEVSLAQVFEVMELMFVFLVPLLTMRAFSEERSKGTMEFLMTAPLSNNAIVMGKYLGVLGLFTLIVLMTGSYLGIIVYLGSPDVPVTLLGYFGIWLEGAFFIAIGVMTSSWTSNQIIAAMTSYVLIFLAFFSLSFSQYATGNVLIFIQQLSTMTHLKGFVSGVIMPIDVVYYLSGILLCLGLTRLCIENRWS